MGASSWVYAVDHQPDTGAALEALRRQVFDAGDYFPRSMNPEPATGTASPLSAEQSLAAFGTVRPDCARIEEWLAGRAYVKVRERWSGIYLICYRNDQPHQIHFAGFSGD
jgi:hypothetical protein